MVYAKVTCNKTGERLEEFSLGLGPKEFSSIESCRQAALGFAEGYGNCSVWVYRYSTRDVHAANEFLENHGISPEDAYCSESGDGLIRIYVLDAESRIPNNSH